jgi:hypothetical protein
MGPRVATRSAFGLNHARGSYFQEHRYNRIGSWKLATPGKLNPRELVTAATTPPGTGPPRRSRLRATLPPAERAGQSKSPGFFRILRKGDGRRDGPVHRLRLYEHLPASRQGGSGMSGASYEMPKAEARYQIDFVARANVDEQQNRKLGAQDTVLTRFRQHSYRALGHLHCRKATDPSRTALGSPGHSSLSLFGVFPPADGEEFPLRWRRRQCSRLMERSSLMAWYSGL